MTLALVVAVITATATTLSSAQQTAAVALPTLPSCPPAPLSLSPCIGYVFGVGSATLASCCSQLRGFLHAQAPCLCAASKLAPSPIGLFLGQAQAMIPNVCDLPNPCDGTLLRMHDFRTKTSRSFLVQCSPSRLTSLPFLFVMLCRSRRRRGLHAAGGRHIASICNDDSGSHHTGN